jgi:RimJ/RimL family protein N-acetyltransferase
VELRTERLLLRRFRDADRAPFAALNADPRVMEHFATPLDRTASDAFVDRIEHRRDERGYSLWAVEVADGTDLTRCFIGYVGLWDATFDAPFTPSVEVGWRLAAPAWGRGYATEAAVASLDDGFTRVGLEEIVSFTTVANRRSRAVMERIGLVRDLAGDFDHPNVPEGHPVRPHVLYRFPDLEARRRQARAHLARPGQTSVTSGSRASTSSAPAIAHPPSSRSR